MLTLFRQNAFIGGRLAAICLSGLMASGPAPAVAQDVKVNFLTARHDYGSPSRKPPLPARDGNLYHARLGSSITGSVGFRTALTYLHTFPSPTVVVVGSYPSKPNCAQAAGWQQEDIGLIVPVENYQDLCSVTLISSRLYQSDATGHIYAAGSYGGTPIDDYIDLYPWESGLRRQVEKGNLVRWRSDGGAARVLDASFNRLGQVQSTLALGQTQDGHDIVYGIDWGTDGKGRVWAVEYADDDARARLFDVFQFPADAQGFPVSPQNMILASDGYLYILLGYWRGHNVVGGPGMRSDPDTPTGALVRLHPSDPQGTFETVRTFTLTDGGVAYLVPGFTAISEIVNGEAVYYQNYLSNDVLKTWQEISSTTVNSSGGANSVSLIEGPDGYIYGSLGYDTCRYYDANAGSAQTMYQACGYFGSGQFAAAWVPRKNPSIGPVDEDGKPVPPYDGYWLDAQGRRQAFYGTLYRVSTTKPAGAASFPFQILHRFRQTDGVNPRGEMAIGGDGAIYGTTLAGGTWREHFYFEEDGVIKDDVSRMIGRGRWGEGTLFRIVPQRIRVDTDGNVLDGGFEHLHDFRGAGEMLDRIDGAHPMGLSAGPDGNLYGLTLAGGRWHVERWGELPDPRLGGSKSDGVAGAIFQVDLSGVETEASITVGLEPPSIVTGMDAHIVWQGNKVTNCEGMAGFEDSGWEGPKLPEGRLLLRNVPAAPNGAAYNFYMACDATDATDAAGNPKRIFSTYAQLRVNMPDQEIIAEKQGYGNGGSTAPWPLGLFGVALWLRRRGQAQRMNRAGANA